MQYFFILGRNPELSRAEIFAYLNARKIEYDEILFDSIYLVLETDWKFDINAFGGVLKLGKILFSGGTKELVEYMEKEEVIPADKFSYSVFGNVNDNIFIDKFKLDKKKAMIRRGGRLKMQSGDTLVLPNADFDIFCYEHEKTIYLGIAEQEYGYSSVKERDMLKPVRREELAISPRLAKIMINLSQVEPGETLLDCFCGVGGILQEAMLLGINVFGVDKDARAIKDAQKNLLWIAKQYKTKTSFSLLVSDAAEMPEIKFQGLASETALGKLMRKKSNDREAEKMIKDFEAKIIPVLKRLKQIKKGLLVFTFPFIRRFSVNLPLVCEKTGLRIYDLHGVKFPIKEFREGQFVSREVVVFE